MLGCANGIKVKTKDTNQKTASRCRDVPPANMKSSRHSPGTYQIKAFEYTPHFRMCAPSWRSTLLITYRTIKKEREKGGKKGDLIITCCF